MKQITDNGYNPLNVEADFELMASIWPEMQGRLTATLQRCMTDIRYSLKEGDSRAALVISLNPLNIACYSDEFDASIILTYPQSCIKKFNLRVGHKLVTSNTYSIPREGIALAVNPDIIEGPYTHHRYQNFMPLIALFCAGPSKSLTDRILQIRASEWDRCIERANEFLRGNYAPRDGCPLRVHQSIKKKPGKPGRGASKVLKAKLV